MTKNRKEALLQLLKEAQKPQNGKKLSRTFSCHSPNYRSGHCSSSVQTVLLSYQPIVVIFIKKAKTSPYVHKLFKVKHEMEEIGQELLAIVDNGGRVQNTLIDHPVYRGN